MRTLAGVAIALLVVAGLILVALTAIVRSTVNKSDAYRALGVTDIADDGVRLANAEVESEPPTGLPAGPRIHQRPTLAHLRYETFGADGNRLDQWEVRALVPSISDPGVRDGAYAACPAECQAELSHGAIRVVNGGDPGIGGEWVLRMPLNKPFELGRRPLSTRDILDDRPRQVSMPSRVSVTLLDVCAAHVQVTSITRLEFFPDAIVPIPRGLRTYRWLQLEGCGPLTPHARVVEPPPPPREPPPQAPEIRAIALRRRTGTGFATLEVDESWFARSAAPIEFVLRGVCRYDADTDRWTALAMPHENVSTRIGPMANDQRPTSRVVARLPEEIALFFVRWVERAAGDRSARNQTFHESLATSGPMLCNDVDLGPAPAGKVAACVPFADRAQARLVAEPKDCR